MVWWSEYETMPLETESRMKERMRQLKILPDDWMYNLYDGKRLELHHLLGTWMLKAGYVRLDRNHHVGFFEKRWR